MKSRKTTDNLHSASTASPSSRLSPDNSGKPSSGPNVDSSFPLHASPGIAFHFFSIAVILIIAAVAFSPVFQNNFTNWDDDQYVVNNPLIRDFSPSNLKTIWTRPYYANYQPLTLLSYSLDYTIYGLKAGGYFLTNLLLHGANSALVYWAVLILSGKWFAALIAALLFAIHPLHVESAAWISERKDVLSTFFFLTSLISYLHYRKRESPKYYFFSLGLFILSLLSKSMTVMLPFVLWLCDYLQRRRLDHRMILEKIPYLAISFVFGIVTIWAQKSYGAVGESAVVPLSLRIPVASHGFLFYLWKSLVPINLSAFYPYPDFRNTSLPLSFLLSPLVVIILAIVISAAARRIRTIHFGALFYLLTVLPVLQLSPAGLAAAADRYFYIPSIGVFFLVGEGLSNLLQRVGQSGSSRSQKRKQERGRDKPEGSGIMGSLTTPQMGILSGVVLVSGILAFLTFQRCQIWKNDLTLWDNVLSQYPDVVLARFNRGNAYRQAGLNDKALEDYTAAIQGDFKHPKLYSNRGAVYLANNQFDLALADLNIALQMNPNYPDALANRAGAYAGKKQYPESIADFTRAIQLNPSEPRLYLLRAVVYASQRDFDNSWRDVHKLEEMNQPIPPDFLNQLQRVSGRAK